MLTLTLPRVVAAFIESKPIRHRKPDRPQVEPGRARLLDQIITINPTASGAFLERFGTRELESYLGHLEQSRLPRGAQARWVRPEGSPGIVVHEPRG